MSRTAVIVGAGPAGLTCALELLRQTEVRPIVFESDTQVGGISRTVEYQGNRMDIGGHRFFSKSDWVMNWWQEILPVAADQPGVARSVALAYQNDRRHFTARATTAAGSDAAMLVRSRLSRIYYGRRFYDYPVKLNVRTVANLGLLPSAAIGLSYARSCLRKRSPERTLEDFLVNRFGDRLYRTFFKSYTEKVWGVSCTEISAEWGAQRIKGLSIAKALAHAAARALRRSPDLAQRATETSLIEWFLYPKFGPGQMWEQVAARVVGAGGELHLRHRVVGIRRTGTRIDGVDVQDPAGGVRFVPCTELVSTMPLVDLVRQLAPGVEPASSVARALPYRDFVTAGLLVKRMQGHGRDRASNMPPDNWIYVQEPGVKLGRLQIFNNWSPYLVRDPATVWLGLEYFCDAGDDLWTMGPAAFLEFAARELETIGLIDRRDVLDGTVIRVPKAYPAYFGAYRDIGRVREWLDGFDNLYTVGRNGMHRYNNQDHSMLAARAAVRCIATRSTDRTALWSVNTEDDYHEAGRGGDDPGLPGARPARHVA